MPDQTNHTSLINKGTLNHEKRFFENIPATVSHRDTHLHAPAAFFFCSIKMKALQFQTGFHCPESPPFYLFIYFFTMVL